MCFGTRDICKQVVMNTMIYDIVLTYSKSFMPSTMCDYPLKEFMQTHLTNDKSHIFTNHLSNFLTVKQDQVDRQHMVLLRQMVNNLPDNINLSDTCWYNKTCKLPTINTKFF